jgi:hypothetical protein
MAITFPLDLIDDLKGIGWSTDFQLMYRQEQSRHASGRTRVKDFGTPIWTATYSTKNLSPNKIDFWKARLSLLENGLNTFYAYPMSRCWPILHPNGEGLAGLTGEVKSLNANNKELSLKSIANLNLSVGDYISANERLYQVMEEESTGVGGEGPEFEIRPHFNINNIAINDDVRIYEPRCIMTLVPGSASFGVGLNGRGSVSFNAIEAIG